MHDRVSWAEEERSGYLRYPQDFGRFTVTIWSPVGYCNSFAGWYCCRWNMFGLFRKVVAIGYVQWRNFALSWDLSFIESHKPSNFWLFAMICYGQPHRIFRLLITEPFEFNSKRFWMFASKRYEKLMISQIIHYPSLSISWTWCLGRALYDWQGRRPSKGQVPQEQYIYMASTSLRDVPLFPIEISQ